MPMGTTKYNHRQQSPHQTHQPPYSWTKYRLSLLLQNIGLHVPGTRYRFPLPFQNIVLHTYGQDMTYSSEVHDKGDPFSKLLE